MKKPGRWEVRVIVKKLEEKDFSLLVNELDESEEVTGYYVPKLPNAIGVLFYVFAKSNMYLSRSPVQFESKGRKLTWFVFRNRDVLVQDIPGKDLTRIWFAKGVHHWLRVAILRKCVGRGKTTLSKLVQMANSEEMKSVSALWYAFVMRKGQRNAQFGSWVRTQERYHVFRVRMNVRNHHHRFIKGL